MPKEKRFWRRRNDNASVQTRGGYPSSSKPASELNPPPPGPPPGVKLPANSDRRKKL